MKQSNETNKKFTLTGKNIYRDKKGQALYLDPKSQCAYRILPEQEGLFQTLSLRWYVSIVVGLLFYFTFLANVLLAIGIAAALFTLMEWKYQSLLNNCVKMEKFQWGKMKLHKNDTQQYENETNLSLIGKATFFLVIGVLLIVNSFVSVEIMNYRLAMFASYLAAAFAFYMGIRVLMIYWTKNQKAGR